MTAPEPTRRSFQFSLRALLVVVSLFALSFGLLRKACLLFDAVDASDAEFFIWFAAGLHVFAGTIGAVIGRMIDGVSTEENEGYSSHRRGGIVGLLVSIVLVQLFVWFVYFMGGKMQGVSGF